MNLSYTASIYGVFPKNMQNLNGRKKIRKYCVIFSIKTSVWRFDSKKPNLRASSILIVIIFQPLCSKFSKPGKVSVFSSAHNSVAIFPSCPKWNGKISIIYFQIFLKPSCYRAFMYPSLIWSSLKQRLRPSHNNLYQARYKKGISMRNTFLYARFGFNYVYPKICENLCWSRLHIF